jgi:UDP-3-O-[3-hydroxymyristoyl] N-acetylglucosamine deacetylase
MEFRELTRPIFLRGRGLHSGEECSLLIEPSTGGLCLEIEGESLPLANMALEGSGRGSNLIFPGGKQARTCEHVLSALTGMGVWRAKLTLAGKSKTAPEMPALDGCADGLSREILEKSVPLGKLPAGDKSVRPFGLRCPVEAGDFSDTSSRRSIVALPSPSFHVTYVIDYDGAALVGTQIFDYDGGVEEYRKEIAPARTFALKRDIDALRAAGLALGGSLDNAILVGETSAETAGGLRFSDEFVRHKVLDLLGDLAALGRPLVAHVIAIRAGHAQHLRLVERLRAVSGMGAI